MIKPLHLTMISLSALIFSGCATAPPPPIDANTLASAAEKILSENIYYNELFTSCAALGGEIEVDAINVQQNWLNANAPLVVAADSYYSQQQAENSFEYAGLTLAPTAIRLVLDARQKAKDELSLSKRSPANQQKTCAFKLAQMAPATLPLSNDPAIARAQTELLKHQPLDETPLSAPRLAGGINAIPGGKSFFTINKSHQSNCPDAYTLVIANDWPKEAYANFCGAKAVEVLICDWGKCDIKKL
ncbi:hypothetical protein [Cellvibrio sp. BR]|uniref:hypothetical protein n=1 Tax=Cellvibrio sp. BR TaxID=1134474 RepID=UPI0002F5D9AF|nr:hypothetical protein [Cellvibrio sp. BR]